MSENREVQAWWRDNPMTYGAEHGRTGYRDGQFEMGTPEFFERLDREFYSWNHPLHGERPFDRLFPYRDYRAGARVLEIGCGLGTMAMNWARNGVEMTAVDLNPTSIEQTRRRFELMGLRGRIELMDGRRLDLPDAHFDYVYSWGVLHHSPDLAQSLNEMMRVLKPGGGFGLMLYHRRSILHAYKTLYTEGFLHYENRFLGPLELASRYGDGARADGNPHTWPVTKDELRAMLGPFSRDLDFRVLGTDLDTALHALLPGLGLILPAWAKKPWARRFGWSLWACGHKS
ncbi:MAG: methyltransferase domain-containing protein [Thiobacillaceae bacterium]|jgi:SAM-dependent methyltransferase|nr:methyltransferase domain-containing protein [Thiobacillaceae bacterium]